MTDPDPIDPSPGPRRRWGSRLLYLGVFLLALLVALAALSVRREWRQRIGQSRSDALFQLVQDKAPARPTETPGATAWLNLELRRYRERIPDPEKARLYGEVAEWQDTAPAFFAPLRALLARPVPPAAAGPGGTATPRLLPTGALGDPGPPGPLSLRGQDYLELDGRWLVVTRRRALDLPDPASPSNRFLAALAPHLAALAADLPAVLARHPLPALPGRRPPRAVRLYALSEDGTLLSLPLAPAESAAAPPNGLPAPRRAVLIQERRRAALAEGRELRRSPERPTFVSNEFYFRFADAPRDQTFYSGLYLDLGGQGLVATITVPLDAAPLASGAPGTPGATDATGAIDATGSRGIVGADLAFDIDWQTFARGIEPPMVADVVHLAGPPPAGRSWAAIAAALPAGRPPALRSAVAALARRPGEGPAAGSAGVPNLLHGVVEGRGAVAAFQVAAATWLVVLFPKTQSHLPLVPALLSAVLLVALLAGFERNRRRAERAFQEKQNLLNTMQVPLIVVDPNTDEVVFGNQAALRLGIRPGSRIGDRIAADPRARAHYERMQVAKPTPRRAYGLPLRVRGEDGEDEERYAIIRSVAVTAPIEALRADERHRLGILFLVEPDADLALLTEDLAGEVRRDERRRLAGLLSHGVDVLLRALAHALRDPAGAAPELIAWLAGYADRRLRTTAWLLDHWDARPPLPPDSSVEAAQARATLAGIAEVFALAAADPDLRTRLHWDNGVLSERPAPPAERSDQLSPAAPVFTAEIDWPEGFWFSCPVRGGFGYFLGEVLINAVRHGRPGSTPAVRLILDRSRRELVCEVANELRTAGLPGGAEDAERSEPYGGRRILERLAHLFEWRALAFERGQETYTVSWRIPVSERGDPRRAD